MLRRVKNQKGFTLIELIAVIAILGVLALLIVPRVGSYNEKANISRAKADLNILKNAIERYDAEHNAPLGVTESEDTLTEASDKLTGKTGEDGSVTDDGKFGPYIDKIPKSLAGTNTIDDIRTADPEDIESVPSGGYVITED